MKKLALLSLVILLWASTALAGNKDKADALFKQGKKLSAEKKYAEACPAFEQSMKLDPAIGTQLNIAKCYEDWGRLGKALVAYRAAEKMAHDAKDPREPKIKALIDDLDSNVPRLTIKLPKQATAEGVVVTLDNNVITTLGESMIVDPGPRTIEWTVDGGPKKQKIVNVERGGDSEVTIDVPKDRVAKKQPEVVVEKPVATPPPPPPTTAPGRNQRLGGLVLGGAGVIAIGVSSLMTLSARGQYNDALEMYCNNAKNMCDPMGLELTHDARSTANTATVIFIVGAAAVGGGVALYLLAPKAAATETEEARYVVPTVSPDGAGVVYGGRF